MLFIYLVEDHPRFAPVVRGILGRCLRRRDGLYTSHLSIAETLVGIAPGDEKEVLFQLAYEEMGFTLVDFNRETVNPFRRLRRDFGLKPPDAMNLSCAAALGADIFLTGDTQLLNKRLHVPGIHFIADFTKAPL